MHGWCCWQPSSDHEVRACRRMRPAERETVLRNRECHRILTSSELLSAAMPKASSTPGLCSLSCIFCRLSPDTPTEQRLCRDPGIWRRHPSAPKLQDLTREACFLATKPPSLCQRARRAHNCQQKPHDASKGVNPHG